MPEAGIALAEEDLKLTPLTVGLLGALGQSVLLVEKMPIKRRLGLLQ